MTTRTARRLGASAAALALLLVAGCGSDEGTESTPGGEDTTASDTTEPTQDDPTESETTEDEESEETEGAPAPEGELDADTLVPAITDAMLEAGTARVEASIDAGGEQLRIEGVQQVGETLADNAMQLTLTGGGLDGELILIDKILYLDLGQVTQGKFVRLDLDDPQTAGMFGQLLQSTDTASAVEALQGAVQDLEVVGPADVDGDSTTQYRLSVDTEKVLSAQGLPPSVSATLPKSLSYDLYVDDDQLLRRLVVEVAGTSSEITTSEWGEPVEVTAPPASQISRQNPFTAPS